MKQESKVVMPFHQLVFQDYRIILTINIKIVWYVRRMYYKSGNSRVVFSPLIWVKRADVYQAWIALRLSALEIECRR